MTHPVSPDRQARGSRRLSALDATQGADDDERGRSWFRRPGWWAVGGVGVIVLLPVVWFALLPTPLGVPVAPPSRAPRTAPETPASPPPTTVAPEVSGTASQDPAPSTGATAEVVELNDAQFTISAGWTLTSDEMIEDTRRTVRLSNLQTDAQLQAVTLGPEATELSASCRSLVDLQETQFANVARQLVVPIGVSSASSDGVRCGFTGVRSSDNVATTVVFTLVSRVSDEHVLMLRSTVPDTTVGDPQTVRHLNAMSCEASSSFGVPLPLC